MSYLYNLFVLANIVLFAKEYKNYWRETKVNIF